MRDGWSETFDPSSPYAYEARRWMGYERDPPFVSGTVLLIATVCLVLSGFIAADVGALANPPVSVQVTQVDWYVNGALLTTSGGFTVSTNQAFTLTLTCADVCMVLYSATVSPPFQFLSFSVAYHPIQYVNVTARAPSSGFDGPLAVTLQQNSAH